ncbi:MAG: hypothetical protein ABEJ25_02060 [Candidatus Bipolaricaulia bacterium]
MVISLLIFGGLAIAAEEVDVPLEAVKSSCYGEVDMTKAEFPLSEVGKECVKDDWLEENLPHAQYCPYIAETFNKPTVQPASNDYMYIHTEEASHLQPTSTDEHGYFKADAVTPAIYSIAYYQSPIALDEIPDIFHLQSSVEAEDETIKLGTIKLPKAYHLDVKVLNQDGVPVKAAPVRAYNCYTEKYGDGYEHRSCFGTGTQRTNEEA